MIESSCIDCSSFQDAPSSPKELFQRKHHLHRQHQIQHQNQERGSGSRSSLSRALAGPSSITPLKYQTKLNYFHHNHLHPLIAPHLLLASSSALAAAATSSPGGSDASVQFALTADARACVTATYLCVLIVNNTWLDCNLLETLCNNSTSGPFNNGPSDNKQGEYSLHSGDSMQLDALESAFNELIAFAGGGAGGSANTGVGEGAANHLQENGSLKMLDSTGIHALPVHFQIEPSKRPIELHDKGGGGSRLETAGPKLYTNHNDLLSQLLHYGQTLTKEDLIRLKAAPDELRPRQQATELGNIKIGRIVMDEDPNKIVEQYFNIGKSQLAMKQNRLQQQQSTDEPQVQLQAPIANANNTLKILDQEQQVATTQQPSTLLPPSLTSTAPSNSLASWVSRPFRGWSSYSFWSSSSDPQLASTGVRPADEFLQPQQQDGKQVQILRPIDRSEYNDIATNQSSLKSMPTGVSQHQQFSNNQHRQYQLMEQQQPEKSGLQVGESSSIMTTHLNGLVLGASNNNNQSPVAPFVISQAPSLQSSTFSDLIGVGSTSVPSGDTGQGSNKQQQQPQNTQPIAFASQLRSSTTPASLMGTYEFPSLGMSSPANVMAVSSQRQHQQQQADRDRDRDRDLHQQKQQQQQHHHHHHLHIPPTMHQQQQHQFQEELNSGGGECKCNDPLDDQLASGATLLLAAITSPPDCRFRCPPAPPTTTASLVEQPTQLVGQASFTTAISASPSGKMSPLDVTFLLYTRYHRDLATDLVTQIGGTTNNNLAVTSAATITNNLLAGAGEPIDLTNETTLSNEFRLNSSLPIKIVIHGFGSGGRRPWVTDMVYKLLDYEDVNVIVVDWEKGAALPNYVQAAGNTRLVGHKIACLIKSINAKYGLIGNSYHLIGFSLGAHVAGFAGMEIRNSTSVPRLWINRITGLDPASPLFEGYEANDRLDPSDAQFVDVIHSNGDGVLRGGFGSLQPMGHVDFYPNGGRVQVGCNSVLLSALSDIIYGKWQSLCNHRRALNFFMDSFEFNKCKFRSFNCDSYENYLKGECFDCGFNNEKCSYMGYLANYSKGRGKMYLTTHEEAPFCGFKTHWGKVEVTLVTLDGKNESFWLSSVSSQQSSGHDLSGGQKEVSQHSMQSLIVAHPMLVNFTQVLIKYTKYKGWIYSGDESWSIDKVFITDSDGQVKSFCGFNTVLESHITTRLNLEPGNCTVVESASSPPQPATATSQQMARGLSSSGNGATNNLVANSGVSSSVQQQQQQQQQQSPRAPRLFASMIPPQSEPQTTPILPHGHAYQRMSPTSSDRQQQQQQQQFALNYNNIPLMTF